MIIMKVVKLMKMMITKCEQLNSFSLEANRSNLKDIWKVSLNMFGNAYDFMIDTLSQYSVFPYNCIHVSGID